VTGPGGLLVSPGALAQELASQPGPALLDVRWRLGGPPGLDSYREGHLPGAVFIDLERDLAAPPGPAGRHPLPDPAVFTDAMRTAGVNEDRPVVVYDDRDATAAARAWWLLRYHGHQNVRVLDGGYQAWLAAGLPVTRADPAAKPGEFTARHPRRALRGLLVELDHRPRPPRRHRRLTRGTNDAQWNTGLVPDAAAPVG